MATGLTGQLCGLPGCPTAAACMPANTTSCAKFSKGCAPHSPTLGKGCYFLEYG